MMRCPECGGETQSALRPFFMPANPGSVCVQDVPMMVCSCGTEYIAFHVVQNLERIRGELDLYESHAPLIVKIGAE